MSDADSPPPLQVRHLTVRFRGGSETVTAVDDVSFSVDRGRTLGIVGESGAGKTALALAILGLHDPAHTVVTGEVRIEDRNIVGLPEKSIRRLRGRQMSLVVQNPLAALHPAYTAGRQIGEAYRAHHQGCRRSDARQRAVEMMARVGIPDPDRRIDDYPHQFSGGMRQRIMIAIALVNAPALLVADEPTTALDVTLQAQILDLLRDLQRQHGTTLVLITHDVAVVGRIADRVMVMYAGRVAELGSVGQVMVDGRHPYTRGLLAAVPSLTGPVDADLPSIPGAPPDLADPPSGCAFHPRCPVTALVGDRCRTEVPRLLPVGRDHLVACHLAAADRP
ncbi:MAG TPA: ABC transporter ATP-binding protein [Nakamurella sp.]